MSAGAAHRLWQSVGFRLAFYYGLMLTLTMVATLAIIYVQTAGVFYQRMFKHVAASAQNLAVHFDEGGVQAVEKAINHAIAANQTADGSIFFFVSRHGIRLAGNMERLPGAAPVLADGNWQKVMRGDHVVKAYLLTRKLPDGSLLIVGNDLRDQQTIESMALNSIALTFALAVAFFLVGVAFFRRELGSSVDAIRQPLMRIAAGDLAQRVELSGDDDEFALLSRDINKMLDRIEALMDGVRHVSDTIAHNLRTPLTRILLRLRAISEDESASSAQRQSLALVILDIEDLNTVFEKLLQIAETEAGARRQEFIPVALHTIVSDVVDLYDAVAEAQGATLKHHPSDAAVVMGDPDLLASAVANLVDNALKYGGGGATVSLATRATPTGALLIVRDNGPGISESQRSRIGTRFLRLDPSQPGHGLGLASIGAIVELHGGRMSFDDALPGLIVRIEFPAHSA